MSRPVSAASGQAAHSQLQRSAPKPRPSSTSTISLFLANLRLLDLDLRHDWPGIVIHDFDTKHAAQNQKRRISCVEWSLFRLFELHDSAVTKEVRRTYLFRIDSPISFSAQIVVQSTSETPS